MDDKLKSLNNLKRIMATNIQETLCDRVYVQYHDERFEQHHELLRLRAEFDDLHAKEILDIITSNADDHTDDRTISLEIEDQMEAIFTAHLDHSFEIRPMPKYPVLKLTQSVCSIFLSRFRYL